jgi:histone deacetylase 11
MRSSAPRIQPKVVYSPDYDIHFLGLEKLHPFDSCKYSRAWSVLLRRFGNLLQQYHLTPSAPVHGTTLELIHTAAYLQKLRRSWYVAEALELGSLALLPMQIIDWRVLQPMRLATMGTVIAAETALENGIAINLSGGYHHASRDRGEGFCIYSDIAIAIAVLRHSQKLAADDSVLIVDLDAHQGNGLERIFHEDPSVHILDMYNQNVYPNDPWARARINCDIPVSSGTRDQQYLGLLRQHLPAFLQTIDPPKIAFYNAGTDVYEYDPLGRLNISQQGILERDRFVFQTLTNAGIPWVMVLSGGYTRDSHRLVADSITSVLQSWGKDCQNL